VDEDTSTVTVLPENVFSVKLFEPTETTVPKLAGPALVPVLHDRGLPGCGEWAVPPVDPASVVVRADAAAADGPAEKTTTAPYAEAPSPATMAEATAARRTARERAGGVSSCLATRPCVQAA
jgi:hypothetical protein